MVFNDRRKPVAAKGEDLLTPKQAAAHLNVSVALLQKDRTVRHLGIPFVQVSPRVVRYRIRDLDQWTQSRIVENNHG